MDKALLKTNIGKKIHESDLTNALKDIGVVKGDVICIHSEIFTLGEPLLNKEDFLSSLISCFEHSIMPFGTIIMPTFTYSFCKNENYDKLNSKSKMGVLSEFFRRSKGVLRTNDPIFSFAIKNDKNNFLKDTISCFGKGCVYDTLKNLDGKIILFGTQNLGYTFVHYVEEIFKVRYRYFKKFSGKIIDENNNIIDKSIFYYVRDLEQNSELSVEKLINLLKKSNNFYETKFGDSTLTAIYAKKFYDELIKYFENDENSLLK